MLLLISSVENLLPGLICEPFATADARNFCPVTNEGVKYIASGISVLPGYRATNAFEAITSASFSTTSLLLTQQKKGFDTNGLSSIFSLVNNFRMSEKKSEATLVYRVSCEESRPTIFLLLLENVDPFSSCFDFKPTLYAQRYQFSASSNRSMSSKPFFSFFASSTIS